MKIYALWLFVNMPLLNLKSDFVFRTVFTRSPNSLINLLNAVLGFSKEKEIKEITILPSEIPKERDTDKLSILDIKAIDKKGSLFNVEIQVFPQKDYKARALYYWAKLFTSQIKEGEGYKNLRSTYSINFLDFQLLDSVKGYKSHFMIKEKDITNLVLTDFFQMIFIELPKFQKDLKKVDDIFEIWLYLIRNSTLLGDDDMKNLLEKNPAMEETLDILQRISLDPKILSAEEAREKASKDYTSNIEGAREEGKLEDAQKMLEKGYPIQDILEITGFTKEKLKDANLL